MLNENVTELYDIIDNIAINYNISNEDIQTLEDALEAVLYPDIEESSEEEEYEEDYSLEYEDEE